MALVRHVVRTQFPAKTEHSSREGGMNGRQIKQLRTAIRVMEYSMAHSDGSAGEAAVLARQKALLAEAGELARQEREGEIEKRNAGDAKKVLRKTFRKLVRHVARVAAVVAKDHPDLVRVFRLPRGKSKEQGILTAVRAIADQARTHEELFLANGLAATLVADLSKATAEYDEATERSSAGKRAHIGANAELGAVLRQIMKIVDLLDGLNQYRFEKDAEKLAAWNSARNIPGPAKESEKVPGEGTVSRAA